MNALTLPVLDAAVTAAENEWLSVVPNANFSDVSIAIGDLPTRSWG